MNTKCSRAPEQNSGAQGSLNSEEARVVAQLHAHLLYHTRVWHVGTLSPADKKSGSLEGAGLSVSVHPQAWQRIAHLSGSLFLLTKDSARFVDARFCLQRRNIMRGVLWWAKVQGYVERRTIYRVSHYDEELEDWLLSDFLERGEAREWYEEITEEVGLPPRLSAFRGYVPTNFMARRAMHERPPLALVRDFALAFFVEDLIPHIDGLWWNDEYSPVLLSAPGELFLSLNWNRGRRLAPNARSRPRFSSPQGRSGQSGTVFPTVSIYRGLWVSSFPRE